MGVDGDEEVILPSSARGIEIRGIRLVAASGEGRGAFRRTRCVPSDDAVGDRRQDLARAQGDRYRDPALGAVRELPGGVELDGRIPRQESADWRVLGGPGDRGDVLGRDDDENKPLEANIHRDRDVVTRRRRVVGHLASENPGEVVRRQVREEPVDEARPRDLEAEDRPPVHRLVDNDWTRHGLPPRVLDYWPMSGLMSHTPSTASSTGWNWTFQVVDA